MTAMRGHDGCLHFEFGGDPAFLDDPDPKEHELMIIRRGFDRVFRSSELIEKP